FDAWFDLLSGRLPALLLLPAPSLRPPLPRSLRAGLLLPRLPASCDRACPDLARRGRCADLPLSDLWPCALRPLPEARRERLPEDWPEARRVLLRDPWLSRVALPR